jgi:hypothetical protein
VQAEEQGVVFRGQLANGTPNVCFCSDAASNYHSTRTSYSHSKKQQIRSPFLDAEPQLIMDLPTSSFLQAFHLFTHLPPELQLNIWQDAISSSPSLIAQITNLQTLRYSTPTTKPPSPPPVPSPPAYTPLTSPALSRSQRWQLSFPFSTAGDGANTQNHPPASIRYDFSSGGDIFWLERLSGAQRLNSADLHVVRRIATCIATWNITGFDGRRGLGEKMHKVSISRRDYSC